MALSNRNCLWIPLPPNAHEPTENRGLPQEAEGPPLAACGCHILLAFFARSEMFPGIEADTTGNDRPLRGSSISASN